MDLRFTFNEDAVNYDKIRPEYPMKMFHDILNYTELDSSSSALEIGIGTGQATTPILRTGCHITAVELGNNLANYTRYKFRNSSNLTVMNTSFEKFSPPQNQLYDLIYSGTAYHWIDPKVGHPKTINLLKPGAILALFWNHPFPNKDDDPVNRINKLIYNKYCPSNKKVEEFSINDCKKWIDTLTSIGFCDVTSKLYHRKRELTSNEYILLLNTYSDHRTLPINIKTAFENEMMQSINDLGGKINIYDTIDLYLARKPFI